MSGAMIPAKPDSIAAPASVSATAAGPALRVQIVSDLHVDVADTGRLRLAPGADLVVVAGDTCRGVVAALGYLRRHIPVPVPIVAVLGNHEFYGRCRPEDLALARTVAPRFGIILLEDDIAVIGGVRFLGATLWTDYALYGARHRRLAMAAAARGLNDHRKITEGYTPDYQPFLPADAARLHAASAKFIADTLAAPFDGPSVVVSHHGPHPACRDPRHGRDPLSAAFTSDLSALIAAGQPALWISGHTHHPLDLMLGRTRLISNPHGYGDECLATFDPDKVVAVPLTPCRGDRP